MHEMPYYISLAMTYQLSVYRWLLQMADWLKAYLGGQMLRVKKPNMGSPVGVHRLLLAFVSDTQQKSTHSRL